jgi:uncharacterized membrane protein required for colicin V production
MDDYILLDLLLGLIVVLFAAIGFWRGAAKEVVVTAGVFAGAALAASWANPWGNDLADLIHLRADVSRLIVAATALLLASLILGYGGSALVGSPEVGWGGRLAGATLAAINGGLVLHYCLSFIERFLTDEGAQRALDRSDVSRVLLHQFGWLLIGAAGLIGTAIVASLLLGRRRAFVPYEPAVAASEPAAYHEPGGRQRPARLPRGADAGKYEPVARGYDPANGRYAADAPSIGQTIPFPPVDAAGLAFGGGRSAPPSSSLSPPDAPHGAPPYAGDEWFRRGKGVTRSGPAADGDDRASLNGRYPSSPESPPSTSARDGASSAPSPEPGANGNGAIGDMSTLAWVRRSAHPGWTGEPETSAATGGGDRQARHCRVCTAELGDGDSFCPRCGAAA